MPKYYCDYCDIFLTHDAKRVRKDHNAGWKHAAQVRAHFLAMNQEKMGRCVGEIVREYGERKETGASAHAHHRLQEFTCAAAEMKWE